MTKVKFLVFSQHRDYEDIYPDFLSRQTKNWTSTFETKKFIVAVHMVPPVS